mmetsp:Transcript_89953/g.253716  ORF Transcript_89953/g.253716 Transcript_89953/m.253716 type:complete len:263 (-) Transcript_89953:1387-2175(-)
MVRARHGRPRIGVLAVDLGQLHHRVHLVPRGLEGLVHDGLQGFLQLTDRFIPALEPDVQLGEVLPQILLDLLVRMLSKCVAVVLNGLFVVVGLHHGLSDLLHQGRIAFAPIDVHGLLERLDRVCWFLDGQQRVAQDQKVLHRGLVIHYALVTSRVRLLVLSVLDVYVGHRGLRGGKLRVVRLHRPQHVKRLVNLAFLDRQLAVRDKNLDLLGRARELSDRVFDRVGGLVQALSLRQKADKQREDRRAVGHGERHHRLLRLFR